MSSKPDSFMPLWIGDYLADTMRLTRDQHGGYLLLIMDYWRNAQALPDDDLALASVTKSTVEEWKRLRPVLAKFFTISDGLWHHGRIEEELKKAKKSYDDKVNKGKAGAAKRWSKHKPEQSSTNAQALPKHYQSQSHLSFPKEKESVVGTTSQKNSEVEPTTGKGWEAEYPRWAKVRQTVGDQIWQVWFSHLHTNGAENSIIVQSPYQASELPVRFMAILDKIFPEGVTFKMETKDAKAPTN